MNKMYANQVLLPSQQQQQQLLQGQLQPGQLISTSAASASHSVQQHHSGASNGSTHNIVQQNLQQSINAASISSSQRASMKKVSQSSGKATAGGSTTAQGSFKIKKEDLKLLQQYCENDLGGIIDIQHQPLKQKNAQTNQNSNGGGGGSSSLGHHHHKTKSEGATPLGTAYIKSHYQGGKGQKMQAQIPPFQMINQSSISAQMQHNAGLYHQQHQHHIQQSAQHQQALLQQQSPFLDYQKFLEDEKLFQNQKAKSHMGYYSVGGGANSSGNPQAIQFVNNNILGGNNRPTQQSKSPDLSIQIKAAHYKSQKHHQSILAGSGANSGINVLSSGTGSGNVSTLASGQGVMNQPSNMISQSALASYSNVQTLLQQHSNRAPNSASQGNNQTGGGGSSGNNSSSLPRPSSRKKQATPGQVGQSLIYDQSQIYSSSSSNYNGIPLYVQKGQSSGGNSSGLVYNNPKAQSVLLHKNNNDDMSLQHHHHQDYHNYHHNTLEGLSKDQQLLNESSNFLSDDITLMKSNHQLMANSTTAAKNKSQKNTNFNNNSQDESYLDASVYEQFIGGPHNISQFTGVVAQGNSSSNAHHKMLEDMNSYAQYIQRPLSQNTIIATKSGTGSGAAQAKIGRQSPSQKNNTTRSLTSQMHHSSQPKKSQRTASLMHNSLNSSGQKQQQQQLAQDRRLLVGRTPSPNFLKRIAGLMNIGNDFIIPQASLYKNANGGTNLIVGAVQSKRSQSKQAFSSNPQQQLQQLQPGMGLQPPISQNFIHIGSNTIQSLDKSLKQKFIKQQTAPPSTNITQIISNGSGSIMTLGGQGTQVGSRFKSGSLTTSANTAQNSPRRDSSTGVPLQRNQAKQQKTSVNGAKTSLNHSSVSSAYQSNTDFHSISDAIKKTSQQQPHQQAINQSQKLKIINDMEEKKALALVKGIKDYPSGLQKAQQLTQQQQQFLNQQQFHQPMKMIGEIMEEEPQPLSSQEFVDEEKHSLQSGELQYYHHGQIQMVNNKQGSSTKAQKKAAGGHKANSKSISHTPNNNIHMLDGGTGSNGIPNHMLGQNVVPGSDAYNQKLAASHAQATLSQGEGNGNNAISLYLEQLQSLRQGQKSQLSHHPAPILAIAPQIAMSPLVSNGKTSNQFFNQQKAGNGKQAPFAVNQAQMQGMQHQINIKPLLQQNNQSSAAKATKQDQDSLSLSRKLDHHGEKGHGGKKSLSGSGALNQHHEPPKIATPSVEMYYPSAGNGGGLISKPESLSKKQHQINFAIAPLDQQKTPFERELDMKANEIKNQNSKKMNQEQIMLQKYKEDSISILKQLQESGSIVIDGATAAAIKEQTLQSKKSSVDQKGQQQQKLVIELGNTAGADGKKKIKGQIGAGGGNVITIGGPAAAMLLDPRSLVNSPKNHLHHPVGKGDKQRQMLANTLNNDEENEEEEQILMTQEEEHQIKEVISDLNHKAFYGKILKKTKEIDIDDENLKHLSPRSREIATVMKIIKNSFETTRQPPVTTTDFYRIGKMLGRGAFGKVNLAMHKLIRKLVAIKSLNKEALTDEAQKQKLMKEVSLLLKLRHNHVVKIYETIETEKHIIIVMELCAGGDLLNYVRKRRRLKEPYAKVIFKQIIDGLCYIHSKYIAHRDIKLDNILLDGKGNVKIADFGVSKQCQKGQLKMTEQCGTPAYIAPEILKDRGYTFSVDLWSAGVVLFAMLYGTVPFKANNMEELHKLIVKGKYVLKDDISIEARNLLRGLLEVNPEKRLTIKQIYRHKWFADLDPTLQLFNDQERDMIRKEYTYNDPRRYNRNENEEPVDCFTEHNLESVYNSLKNVTSKSIILAPFNSTQSQFMEEGKLRASVERLIMEKMMILKFARRCREIDRQYEFNNNGELDNGVYHKFINNTEEQEDSGDENANDDVDKDLLCIPMLMSSRIDKPSLVNNGGRTSIENSFEEDSNLKKVQERQVLAQKIKESSALQKELHRNRKQFDNEIDVEMVQTLEEFQSRLSNEIENEKIKKLVQYGYPTDYVVKSLEENEPNYCTAGYYLLGMDQNYC